MIKTMQTEKVTLFDRLSIVFSPGVNVLIGENGTWKKQISFRKHWVDILDKAVKEPNDNALAKKMQDRFTALLNGNVEYNEEKQEFLIVHNGIAVPVDKESEGMERIALVWRLIQNGFIENDTTLLWDEPDVYVNPKIIPDLVELLLELSRNGVQVISTTHSYLFAKYFDLRKKETDRVCFSSLYKEDRNLCVEQSERFKDLRHNDIMDAYSAMLDEVYNTE